MQRWVLLQVLTPRVFILTLHSIIPLQAQLWEELYFIFLYIFPNALTVVGNISLASLGTAWTNFSRKYTYAASLMLLLACQFIYL